MIQGKQKTMCGKKPLAVLLWMLITVIKEIRSENTEAVDLALNLL